MSNEAVKNLVRKHPISVGCAALSLLLVGAIYFRRDKVAEAETELAQKTEEGERHDNNKKNSAQLKEQHEALLAARKEIDSRLIRASQLGANSQIFYTLESQTGVKFAEFRPHPAPTKATGAFVPVGFSVTMQGELPQLLTFLRTLEGGLHYTRVLGATCSLNGANRQLPLLLTLNLELLGVP